MHKVDMSAEDSTDKTSDAKSIKFGILISAFLQHNLSGQSSNSNLTLKNKYSAIMIHTAIDNRKTCQSIL